MHCHMLGAYCALSSVGTLRYHSLNPTVNFILAKNQELKDDGGGTSSSGALGLVDKDSLEEQLLLASLDSKSCINGWSNRLFISRN